MCLNLQLSWNVSEAFGGTHGPVPAWSLISAFSYMIIDVNSPLAGQSIDRSNPSSSYNTGYLEHIFTVVEAFKSYPNTLGFFAGNEIINDVPTAKDNPPYIRAVQRDLKNYIAAHADRTIPVGYSAADVREVLEDTWAYLQCDIDGKNDTMTLLSTNIPESEFCVWKRSNSTRLLIGYTALTDEDVKTVGEHYLCQDISHY